MILFKYCPINDYLKRNLAESTIWFSAPNTFNDIEDSNLGLDWRFTDEDVFRELEFSRQMIYMRATMNKDYSDGPVLEEQALELFYKSILSDRTSDGMPDRSGRLKASLKDAFAIRTKTIGISCFAQHNLNKVLWAHYADKYEGICMQVDTSFDEICFQKLEAVQYAEPLPRFKVLAHLRDNLIRLYTTKHAGWSYEGEIRAFQHVSGLYQMNPRCLVNIFFGERAKNGAIDEICGIVRTKYGERVRALKMIREDGEFSFRQL